MRDRIIANVRARLERFAAGSDPGIVLAPEALDEANALIESVSDPREDLEVAYVTGWLHWFRHLALPAGADMPDFLAAARLLEPCYEQMPDSVPDPIREFLELARSTQDSGTAVQADRAGRLLKDALRSGDGLELDLAIDALRESTDEAPAGHPGLPGRLSNLCLALWRRFEQLGEPADLDAAIKAGRRAVELAEDGQPELPAIWSNLAVALHRRYERSGEPADQDEVIMFLRRAAAAMDAGDPARGTVLMNLSSALRARFERSNGPEDLAEAVTTAQLAVDATPSGHPSLALRQASLASKLHVRYETARTPEDLDAAVRAIGLAVQASELGSLEHAQILSILGSIQMARFESTGELADLDAAIDAERAAADTLPPGHPDLARTLTNLGGALTGRFNRTGDLTDLDEAIKVGRRAVDTTPGSHVARPGMLSNLSATALDRFERTRQPADLDEALAAGREALTSSGPGDPIRPAILAHLCNALRRQFDRTGALSDINAAIESGREAVAAGPRDHPDRAKSLSALGAALMVRFERTADPADINEAIPAYQEATHLIGAGPDRAKILSNLGAALVARFQQTGVPADLDRALAAEKAAAEDVTASPMVRAMAARKWGWIAGVGERWPEAVAGFEEATGLLGMVAPRSLARRDQEHLLEELDGMASQVAACCVRAGRTDRAIELLDQSRGVLLGQALDTRTDLVTLAAKQPTLAGRFTAILGDLDLVADWKGEAERRRETVRAFDQVIAEIRAQPGFEAFLLPPSVSDLSPAAAEDQVVVVNISRFGSHALILTGDGVREPVPLHLGPDDLIDQVVRFLEALGRQSAAEANSVLVGVLAWLWDVIAGPVLDQLQFKAPPAPGQNWPRLWWCAPGLLSYLPLHAAGRHDTRCDPTPQTVLDRVVSSYTPTIRALAYARRTRSMPAARPGGGQDILTVAMPETPGASPLTGALAEAELISRRFPRRTRTLTGSQATYEEVTEALPNARWAHFACHASARLDNPSASRLLLHDHLRRPFTVIDVAGLHLEGAELAFLSACSTAGASDRLTDEAIHLATAFQLAGYRHVIGTLWPVNDRAAVRFAGDLYEAMARTGTENIAAVLHHVVRRQRDSRPALPLTWASHLHIGP